MEIGMSKVVNTFKNSSLNSFFLSKISVWGISMAFSSKQYGRYCKKIVFWFHSSLKYGSMYQHVLSRQNSEQAKFSSCLSTA
jgi:hypothetical protein